MDAVKQIFYAFGDRTATLSNAHGIHKLGLIKFDHTNQTILALTDEVRALIRLRTTRASDNFVWQYAGG